MKIKVKTYTVIICLCCLFIPSNDLKAQEHRNSNLTCNTLPDKKSKDFYKKNRATINYYKKQFLQKSKGSKTNAIENSIPIKAHIIRETNGLGGVDLQEIKNAIERLNNTFDEIGLNFFLCGEESYINSSDFYNLNLSTEESALINQHVEENVINMFFINTLVDHSNNGVGGLSYYPGGHDIIYITNKFVNTSLIEHEMGHFFSLLHTHGSSNTALTTELVDRSNCDTDGDEICDTPADPKLGNHNVDSNCNYFGSLTDKNGDAFTPDTNNQMSYALKSCRTSFSEEQYARMYAVSRSVRNYFECPTFKADFSFEVESSCSSNKAKVSFSDLSSGATSWQWDVDNDGTLDYTDRNPFHYFNKEDNYTIKLTIKNNEGFIAHKTYSKFISVGSQNLPYNEVFEELSENNIKGWKIESPDNTNFKWEINSGYTQIGDSGNTGPKGDYSSGDYSGNYFYTRSAAGNKGDVTNLISPCIQINSANVKLTFAYHMFGMNIGELHLDIDDGNGFVNDVMSPIIGQQQQNQADAYILREIDLSSYKGKNIKLRFRVVNGNWWFGDIAIDNINIKESKILSIDDYKKKTIKIYPNPVKTDLFIESKSFINSIIIYDYTGKTIMVKKIIEHKKSVHLDVARLTKGIYFLEIVSGFRKRKIKIIK